MDNELIKESLKISIGEKVLIFLKNGFRYEGKLQACDDVFLKIYDFKKDKPVFIRFDDINEVELS